MFKKKTKQKLVETRNIPLVSGIVVRADGITYLVKPNKRLFKFFSERVFESWSLPRYDVEKSRIVGYKMAGTIGYREGSLIQNFVDGKIYLVSENKRRLVTDPDIVDSFGRDIILASEAEIKLHDEGESIDGV